MRHFLTINFSYEILLLIDSAHYLIMNSYFCIYFSSEEFPSLLEEILENTIFNIMSEASKREINLTARPRLVALPPSAKGRKMDTQ